MTPHEVRSRSGDDIDDDDDCEDNHGGDDKEIGDDDCDVKHIIVFGQ